MLKEMEWMTINNILLELYAQNNLDQLSLKLMRVLRMLIPYTKGYLILLNNQGKIQEPESCFIGLTEKEKREYIPEYYHKDYLQYLYDLSEETRVYKDTDIIDEERRCRTEFFRKFLQPADIPYGCGILIHHQGELMAVFNLFRSSQLGDFSDKDLEILNILKNHIKNMIVQVTCLNQRDHLVEQCFQETAERYSLTERESEVMRLLSRGMSNHEICDQLTVSLSTVKKHIYNLFNKTQVRSRTQLINLLYQQ